MLFDDAATDPKAETGAGESLGRKKGFEEMALRGAVHAHAIVGNGQPNPLAPGNGVDGGASADDDAAAVRKRIDSVGDEVGDQLANFAIVNDQVWNIFEVSFDSDVMFVAAVGKQSEDCVYQVLKIGRAGMRGGAVEAQSLDGDLGYAGKLGLSEFDKPTGVVSQIALLKKVKKVGNGGQGVIDLVRDHGCEATGNGELLCATKDFLAFFAHGNIGDEDGDAAVFDGILRIQDRDANQDIERFAVGESAG